MKLTIFTPTYNRSYTLQRLFESLRRQSDKRFEWLICDDGSEDNTEEIIKQFIDQTDDFQIKYLKQQHGGKHRAQNFAINQAEGDYFITCDSNKFLVADAVEKILFMFASLEKNTKICGVGGYRADFQGNVYGGKMHLNGKYIDCTNLERAQFNLNGDKATAFYTKILKKYPFPEFENEYFISESAWLTPMAMDGYKIRWFPEILVYGEYTDDGLTKQGANEYRGHYNNYYGFLYVLNWEIKAYGILEKLPELYEAIDIARKKKVNKKELCEKLQISKRMLQIYIIRNKLGKAKRLILNRI